MRTTLDVFPDARLIFWRAIFPWTQAAQAGQRARKLVAREDMKHYDVNLIQPESAPGHAAARGREKNRDKKYSGRFFAPLFSKKSGKRKSCSASNWASCMLLTLMLGAGVVATAQTAITVRYFGLTVHPFGDQTASIQPYKLDKNAKFVLNFGGFASVDHYIYKDLLCVTVMQGLFTDCSAGWGGFSHFGIRALIYERGKHRFMLGIGPMLYYREDWNRFEEYTDRGSFNRYHSRTLGDVQWRIFPVAGEFAWHWRLAEHWDFNFGFTPGLPMACSFSFGTTWWPHRVEKGESTVKVYIPKKDRKLKMPFKN